MINLGLRLALIVFFVKCWAGVHAEVFVVTSNADSGPGTLREAMQRAADNGTDETDEIRFGISGISEADRTIALLSQLPMLSSRLTIDASTQPGDAFAGTDAKIRLMADLDAWVLSEREASETGVFHGEQLTDFSLYAIMVHGFDGIKNSHQYGGVLDLAAVYLKEVSRITIGERGKGNAFLDRAPSIYIPPKEWPTDATRPAMENLDITYRPIRATAWCSFIGPTGSLSAAMTGLTAIIFWETTST